MAEQPTISDEPVSATQHDVNRPTREQRRSAISERFARHRAERDARTGNSANPEETDQPLQEDVVSSEVTPHGGKRDKRSVSPAAFYPIVSAVSNILAAKRGEHWRFTRHEIDALSEALADCASHLPWESKQAGIIGSLFALATVTVAVVYPRIEYDAKMAKTTTSRQSSAQNIPPAGHPPVSSPTGARTGTGANGSNEPVPTDDLNTAIFVGATT